VVRPTDEQFANSVKRHDSIVLIKGARQMGKTSLLARGLRQARSLGFRVVLTDFQKLNHSDFQNIEALYKALGGMIAEQLSLDITPNETWNSRRGASINFERFIRLEILRQVSGRVVWGLDEVDRLFTCPFGSEVFGLFRSWHNERSLDPDSPWDRLSLAIVYATEAHLFITDPNQSPFNVGTRLELKDFSITEVAELNGRYSQAAPLTNKDEMDAFYDLVGGQPYLVRKGLEVMSDSGLSFEALDKLADTEEGPFGDHLRRLLFVLARDTQLVETVREVIQQGRCSSLDMFYRLRSAGVLAGDSSQRVNLRCRLYTRFLRRHFLRT
jgi:hypothetical protein